MCKKTAVIVNVVTVVKANKSYFFSTVFMQLFEIKLVFTKILKIRNKGANFVNWLTALLIVLVF